MPAWAFDPGSGDSPTVFAQGGPVHEPHRIAVGGPNDNIFVFSSNLNPPDGSTVRAILEYDGQTGAYISIFTAAFNNCYNMVFHPVTGNLLVADEISDVGLIRQYDSVTGMQLAPFVPLGSGDLEQPHTGLAFGPNGNLFVGDYDSGGRVREYDGATGEYLGIFAGYNGVDLSGNGRTMAFKPGGPYPAPALTALDVSQADNSGWLSAVVDGAGLQPGLLLTLETPGEPQIVGYLTEFAGDTLVSVNFDLTGAAPGVWDLVASYPDGQSAVLAGVLDVVASAPLPLTFSQTEADSCAPLYDVVVTGERLTEGSTYALTRPGQPDIPGYVLLGEVPSERCCGFLSETEVHLDFLEVSGATPGTWDLLVTHPAGQSALLPGVLTITGCPLDYTFHLLTGRYGFWGDRWNRDFQPDHPLGGASNWRLGDDGTVRGSAFLSSFAMLIERRPLSWKSGALQTDLIDTWLDSIDPPRKYSSLRGLSEAGASVAQVRWYESHFWQYRNYLLHADGTTEVLPVANFGGCQSILDDAWDISPDGSLVSGQKMCLGQGVYAPILWFTANSTWDQLLAETAEAVAVNDSGIVVLWIPGRYPDTCLLFDYFAGTFEEIVAHPDYEGWSVTATALANSGMAVGYLGGSPAFSWLDGQMTMLGDLVPYTRNSSGRAWDVNEHGDAVGHSMTCFVCLPAFALLYPAPPDSGSFVHLHDLFIAPATEGAAHSSAAKNINNNGWIVGTFEERSDWGGGTMGQKQSFPWLLVPNLKGDMDRNGTVDGGDIQPFVDVLLGSETDPGQIWRADMDRDSVADLDDQPAFVAALLGQPPPTGACCTPTGFCVDDVTATDCALLHGGTYQGDGTTCATVTCPGDGQYSNEMDLSGGGSYSAPGAGIEIGDDLTLGGTWARDLVYLDLLVYGGGGGPFDVTVDLYTACPGDGGTLIPGTTFTWTAVPDDGWAYILSVDPVSPTVTVPDTVWMVATFSTAEAGWIIAGEAEIGFTANIFGLNDPPWECGYWLGGNPYAGFWANLECIEGPPAPPPAPGRSSGPGQTSELHIIGLDTPTPLLAVEPAARRPAASTPDPIGQESDQERPKDR